MLKKIVNTETDSKIGRRQAGALIFDQAVAKAEAGQLWSGSMQAEQKAVAARRRPGARWAPRPSGRATAEQIVESRAV